MCHPSTDRGDCIPNILPFTNTETLLNFNYRITVTRNKKIAFFKFIIFSNLLLCSRHCSGAPLVKVPGLHHCLIVVPNWYIEIRFSNLSRGICSVSLQNKIYSTIYKYRTNVLTTLDGFKHVLNSC